MTIINNIEIDNIEYQKNIIKDAILNNEPIEKKLNVIIVVSNPVQFAKRYILAREFIKRFEDEVNVELFIVELIYPNQKYIITDSKNKNHLQLKADKVIWHKENMINVGVQKLLPKKWKAMAWIDADIEFENASWASDTLKILNGCSDVVQLFSHCCDLDKSKLSMSVFNSLSYQFTKGNKYCNSGVNFWHPGFAWACTRRAYEKMGGLYENAILGSGDHVMALSFIGQGIKSIHGDSDDGYKQDVKDFEARAKNLRLGYTPGVIRHFFHGSKANRKYSERWKILIDHKFNPKTMITRDENGVLVPTKECPEDLLSDIVKYFKERNEDE
jgi:hypothetical protein